MNIINPNFSYNQTRHWTKLDMENVTSIIIHHTAIEHCTVDQINEWHLVGNKWAGGIGYNEFITKDGTVYICRAYNIGAHTQSQNSKSYGIALEGDYDKETYVPQSQIESLIERIKFNKTKFPNFSGVFPHSYFSNTNCPGRNLNFAEILRRVDEKPEIDINYKNCVDLVVKQLNLNTPEYWYMHNDEFVKILITKMANRLYQLTDV